jgi:hypothetical protein
MHDRNTPNHTHAIRPRGIDPQWLRDQLVCVIEWALDIAARLALRDQDDVDAIERVRGFVRLYVAGRRAEVPVRDVLATVGILISRIHVEDEGTALSVLAPLATMREVPSELPAMLRVREVAALDAEDSNGTGDEEFVEEAYDHDVVVDDDYHDHDDGDGDDDRGDDDRDDKHEHDGDDDAPGDGDDSDDDVVVADAPDDFDEPDSIPPWRHLAGW